MHAAAMPPPAPPPALSALARSASRTSPSSANLSALNSPVRPSKNAMRSISLRCARLPRQYTVSTMPSPTMMTRHKRSVALMMALACSMTTSFGMMDTTSQPSVPSSGV